jgi:hypothetical protein
LPVEQVTAENLLLPSLFFDGAAIIALAIMRSKAPASQLPHARNERPAESEDVGQYPVASAEGRWTPWFRQFQGQVKLVIGKHFPLRVTFMPMSRAGGDPQNPPGPGRYRAI